MTTKFQHIISTAGFSGIAGQVFRKILRVEKMLLITTASRSKSMVVNHGMPEEFRELFAGLILCQFIVTRFGYDFRDKRIRMFGSQVLSTGQLHHYGRNIQPTNGTVHLL